MPSCVHGDVCRAWMNKTNSFAPLSQYCPECVYFEYKNDVGNSHIPIDEYGMYHDTDRNRYEIKRRHR